MRIDNNKGLEPKENRNSQLAANTNKILEGFQRQISNLGEQLSQLQEALTNIATELQTGSVNASTSVSSPTGTFDNASVNNTLSAGAVNTSELDSDHASIDSLSAMSATVMEVNADSVKSDSAEIIDLKARNLDVDNLEIAAAKITQLESNKIKANTVETDRSKAKSIETKDLSVTGDAQFQDADFNNARGKNLSASNTIIGKNIVGVEADFRDLQVKTEKAVAVLHDKLTDSFLTINEDVYIKVAGKTTGEILLRLEDGDGVTVMTARVNLNQITRGKENGKIYLCNDAAVSNLFIDVSGNLWIQLVSGTRGKLYYFISGMETEIPKTYSQENTPFDTSTAKSYAVQTLPNFSLILDGKQVFVSAPKTIIDGDLQVNGYISISGFESERAMYLGTSDFVTADENGNLSAKGISANGNISATGNATVGGDLSVTGNATVSGDETVTGSVSVGGYSTIEGDSTVKGAVILPALIDEETPPKPVADGLPVGIDPETGALSLIPGSSFPALYDFIVSTEDEFIAALENNVLNVKRILVINDINVTRNVTAKKTCIITSLYTYYKDNSSGGFKLDFGTHALTISNSFYFKNIRLFNVTIYSYETQYFDHCQLFQAAFKDAYFWDSYVSVYKINSYAGNIKGAYNCVIIITLEDYPGQTPIWGVITECRIEITHKVYNAYIEASSFVRCDITVTEQLSTGTNLSAGYAINFRNNRKSLIDCSIKVNYMDVSEICYIPGCVFRFFANFDLTSNDANPFVSNCKVEVTNTNRLDFVEIGSIGAIFGFRANRPINFINNSVSFRMSIHNNKVHRLCAIGIVYNDSDMAWLDGVRNNIFFSGNFDYDSTESSPDDYLPKIFGFSSYNHYLTSFQSNTIIKNGDFSSSVKLGLSKCYSLLDTTSAKLGSVLSAAPSSTYLADNTINGGSNTFIQE